MYGYSQDDLSDPAKNIDAGAQHLAKMLRQNNGDTTRGLQAYHSGQGNVDKHYGGIESLGKRGLAYADNVIAKAPLTEAVVSAKRQATPSAAIPLAAIQAQAPNFMQEEGAESFGPAPAEKSLGIVGQATPEDKLAMALQNPDLSQGDIQAALDHFAPTESPAPPNLSMADIQASLSHFAPDVGTSPHYLPDEQVDALISIAGSEEGQPDPQAQGRSKEQTDGTGSVKAGITSLAANLADETIDAATHAQPVEGGIVALANNLTQSDIDQSLALFDQPPSPPNDTTLAQRESMAYWKNRLQGKNNWKQTPDEINLAEIRKQRTDYDPRAEEAAALGLSLPAGMRQSDIAATADTAAATGGEGIMSPEFQKLLDREQPDVPDIADLIKEQRKMAYANALIQLGAGVAGGSLSKGMSQAGTAMAAGNKSARDMEHENRLMKYMDVNKNFDRDLAIISRAGTIDIAKARMLMDEHLQTRRDKNMNRQLVQTLVREMMDTYSDDPETGRPFILQFVQEYLPEDEAAVWTKAMAGNQGVAGADLSKYD
jgi:hypothetical protein